MSAPAAPRRIVPIACTLSPSDVPDRLAEWKAFARDFIVARDIGTLSIRLLLAPGDEVLVAAASLAQREKACCAFFEFSLALDADDRWLCISVPEGAEATLAGFVELTADGLY